MVNPMRIGPMELSADNMVNFRVDAADSVPLQLENRNKTNGDVTAIRWKFEDGNSTAGYYPVELGGVIGTTVGDANARNADFKLWVSDTDNVDRANDCRLHVTHGGEVKATNAGGSLKQVARVHKEDFTLGATDTYKEITHNLGTNAVVISCRINTDATPTDGYEHVEVRTKIGDNGNDDTSNTITVYWATAPTDKKWTVTVIG